MIPVLTKVRSLPCLIIWSRPLADQFDFILFNANGLQKILVGLGRGLLELDVPVAHPGLIQPGCPQDRYPGFLVHDPGLRGERRVFQYLQDNLLLIPEPLDFTVDGGQPVFQRCIEITTLPVK